MQQWCCLGLRPTGGFMHKHGAMGLGQVGGLVACIEGGYGVPTMVPCRVIATDRGAWPGAGFAEVVALGHAPVWVPDVCLVPIVPTYAK